MRTAAEFETYLNMCGIYLETLDEDALRVIAEYQGAMDRTMAHIVSLQETIKDVDAMLEEFGIPLDCTPQETEKVRQIMNVLFCYRDINK